MYLTYFASDDSLIKTDKAHGEQKDLLSFMSAYENQDKGTISYKIKGGEAVFLEESFDNPTLLKGMVMDTQTIDVFHCRFEMIDKI